MTRPVARPTVQIDNEQTKVTRWDFPVDGETGWHRHACNYVVVPLTTGSLLLETADDEMVSQLNAGVSYYRGLGAEHNVVNTSGRDFAFVEIEFK